MKDEKEIKWEQSQIANWKNDSEEIITFFRRFNLDAKGVYQHVTNLDYNRIQIVCYLLSKIDKAIKICDFLDDLENNNHEDVDVIKIYMLISHAEIALRSFKGRGSGIDLVNKFFEPVESELKYRITYSLSPKIQTPENINFAYILYKIRCEYTHEGNYTGRIFKKDNSEYPLIILFKDFDKKLSGSCGITYKEFLEIYMKALLENIKIFSGYDNEKK